MTTPTLVIGDKNCSSWSMRSWLMLRGFGIHFDELKCRTRTTTREVDPGA